MSGISHKNTREALSSLKDAEKALSGGTSIAILPEGHRSRDGKLQFFIPGTGTYPFSAPDESP